MRAMKSERLLPWAGANTANAQAVGELLQGLRYVAVPFVGGFCEIPHIKARQIVVNDLHKDCINLGRQVATRRRDLLRLLRWMTVSRDTRQRCINQLICPDDGSLQADLRRAVAYFASQWMGRSGASGTDQELRGGVPVRRNANGGGTAQRYWTAVRGLAEWGETMRRCDFESLDWAQFLDQYGQDLEGHGIYADPPSWPGARVRYSHAFTHDDHRSLADRLRGYRRARVVVRYGDHPLIRDLYREADGWRWQEALGRNQANREVVEVLIVRN